MGLSPAGTAAEDERLMRVALEEARRCLEHDDVCARALPIDCARLSVLEDRDLSVIDSQRAISRGHRVREATVDAVAREAPRDRSTPSWLVDHGDFEQIGKPAGVNRREDVPVQPAKAIQSYANRHATAPLG